MIQAKRAVVLLHGIRTRGAWQKQLVSLLALQGLVPFPLDYGFFSAVQLLLPACRRSKVAWLRQQLHQVRQDSGDARPSIICHSFGSYMLGKLLQDEASEQFDQVLMVGSILPRDYPWSQMLSNGQVGWVRNEIGRRDAWPWVASLCVGGAGTSGRDGFIDTSAFMHQVEHRRYGHSDFFSRDNFQRLWLPELRWPRRRLKEQLLNLRRKLAGARSVAPESVNLSVYLCQDDGSLLLDTGLACVSASAQVSLSIALPHPAADASDGVLLEVAPATLKGTTLSVNPSTPLRYAQGERSPIG